MAFTVTARHSGSNGATSSATHTTGSTTPTASSLLLLFWESENDADPTAPAFQTPTGGGWTYTAVNGVGDSTVILWSGDGAFRIAGAMYRADIGGSPSAHTITVDSYSGATTGWYREVACDITGHSSSTPVQSAVNGADSGASSSASGTVTLGSTATTGNLVVVAFGSGADAGGGFAAPTYGGQSMTQLFNQSDGPSQAGMWYRVVTGAESTNTITCSDLGESVGNYVAIAVEIPAAGAAGQNITPGATTVNVTPGAVTVAEEVPPTFSMLRPAVIAP